MIVSEKITKTVGLDTRVLADALLKRYNGVFPGNMTVERARLPLRLEGDKVTENEYFRVLVKYTDTKGFQVSTRLAYEDEIVIKEILEHNSVSIPEGCEASLEADSYHTVLVVMTPIPEKVPSLWQNLANFFKR